MNLKLLTAAAVLSTAIAAPALAQDPAPRAVSVRHQQDSARIYHRDNGFWPAEVAAGVVGGAIGTAGAIATAPFRNGGYAYNDAYGYNDGYYGQRYYGGYNSGFVCQPGTIFRGEDGRRHICQ
jgi:hypothetical protein